MREIVCADALPWLSANRACGAVITSPPDAEEVGLDIAGWLDWLTDMMPRLFAASTGLAVVYVTDRKHDGRLVSKAQLYHGGALDAGFSCLWHKVVLRKPVGSTDLHRPGFTHLIAFGRGVRPGKASPDVMERGAMLYPNAMGMIPARFAVEFAVAAGATRILDPFCGKGTIPAVADALGVDATGIDIDQGQCDAASGLRLKLRGRQAP